jgi:hypothetical protein
MVDHASDLPPDQIAAIQDAAIRWKGKLNDRPSSAAPREAAGRRGPLESPTHGLARREPNLDDDRVLHFRSQVWIGNLDCRSLEEKAGIGLATEPRFVFQMPEYGTEHLLTLYAAIGGRQEAEWGEAILHTFLDWCGTDLALAESLGAYFYGDWRGRIIYDDLVADCIGRWLETDPLVEEYRQTFRRLEEKTNVYISLLNSGGKILSHSPYCDQEPDECIRDLFMSGVISANLLQGFYQYRNLTVRLLALQSEPDAPPVDALDMLRRYSNGRIAAVLQDAELSLRLLALRCFSRMGYDAVRDKLQNTRTDEQAVPTDLRKSLLEWAKTTGGQPRQQELGQYLSQYQRKFEAERHLWARIRGLYAKDLGVELGPRTEPPVAKAVSYLTFGELTNLILSLDAVAFPRWTGTEIGKDPPGKRWPGYVALLRRLRNQSAHLRNVAFQDIEDLMVTVREMRKDIEKYA